MKCKRLLSLLLPTAILLSGCQQVLATNHTSENILRVSRDVDSYHQTVTLKTEVKTTKETGVSEINELYSITEATLYPTDSIAYGTRIIKNNNSAPFILNMYGTNEIAFTQKNNEEWISSVTVDPIFTSIEIYPYETFVELSEIFAEKGTWIESDNEFLIDYSGVDPEINQKVSSLLKELPVSHTSYDVSISLNRSDHRLLTFSYTTEVKQGQQTTTQEINSVFSNYNAVNKQDILKKLQTFIESN